MIHCSRFILKLTALALPLALLQPLQAEVLQLKHRSLQIDSGTFELGAPQVSFRKAAVSHNMVRITTPLIEADLQNFAREGLHLLKPLGRGIWIAAFDTNLDLAKGHFPVDWAASILAADKMGPGVRNENYSAHSAYENGQRVFQVVFHADVDLEEAGLWLQELGAEADHTIRSTHTWVCAFDPEGITELLQADEVLWVQETTPPLTSNNSGARQYTHSNQAQGDPHNLLGEGVTVTVYDGGLVDTMHPAFEGRAIVGASESGAVVDHPTHVAGSVGCNHSTQYGMAPACNIVSYEYEACDPFCLYDSPQDIEADHSEAINLYNTDIITCSIGANIYSNGYDCEWQGDYENTSVLIDGIVRGSQGRPVIMTWAAGNERGGGSCGSTYETMSVPSCAKNPIVVGATIKNASDGMTSFSSWGPSDDGRIKPDVCAPGQSIISTLPGGGTGSMSGTSMATPITAGCIAQLVQEYRNTVPGGTQLSPALAKSLMVQTARDRGTTGPDYQYGYGRINVEEAVLAMQQGHWLEDRIAEDDEITYNIQVPAESDRLQLSLSWADLPGAYLDFFELVNDLDMVLIAPDAQEYQPWVLDPASPATAATTGPDALNTVEQVTVNDPMPGTWQVRITGSSIAVGTQDFALAADVSLQSGNTGIIAGTLVSTENEEAISDVHLSTNEHPANSMSDISGNWQLRLPLGSSYTLHTDHYQYYSIDSLVTPMAGDTTWIDLLLNPRPLADLALTLHSGGVALPFAQVSITGVSGPLGDFTADEQGLLSVELPAGQDYEISLSYSRDTAVFSAQHLDEGGSALSLELEGSSFLASDPDASGYIMVDNLDLHPLAIPYQWVELDPDNGGPGTTMNFSDDDQTITLELPFTFTHYGVDYTQISVCGNGWISMGSTTDNDWSGDEGFPDPDGPPAIIAPFWEDLSPQRPTSGNIVWWDDSTGSGTFGIQFTAIEQFTPTSAHETFQVILRDPLMWPTASGNGEILFVYGPLDDISEIAVGIENEAETEGLQIYNNGAYHPNAPEIAEGTTILLTSISSEATVRGTVSLLPDDETLFTQIRVATIGDTVAVQPDGTFILNDVLPGQRPFWALGPMGVETLVQIGTVPVGDTLDLDPFELWQLLSPAELNLLLLDESTVEFEWQPPNWETLNATLKEQMQTDAFSSYRIYRMHEGEGETAFSLLAANISETSFTEVLESPGMVHYVVSAFYEGGESLFSDTLSVDAEFTGVSASILPTEFYLAEATPNPFNPTTRLAFGLTRAQHVRVNVYNLLGQHVAQLVDNDLPAGHHSLNWNASKLASGQYFLRFEHAESVEQRKLLLLK